VLARLDGAWTSLGGTKVSTGQTGRRDYYLTPTDVLVHADLILDWRAEGTFNEHHIRGLGLKGMRVWDFGWQRVTKGWGTGEEGDIRLLLLDRTQPISNEGSAVPHPKAACGSRRR
jgi:hypothetical protein